MSQASVSFEVSKEDAALIGQIVKRGHALADKFDAKHFDSLSFSMDVTACHANGCPLKLMQFLEADDFNFAHDLFGINKHLNRTTGALEGFFLPRFAA